jgi:uncharacterized protein with von Willebrand factor type A (vWA) domain
VGSSSSREREWAPRADGSAAGAYPERMRVRYSQWDGSQDPFGHDLSAADLLDEMSDDLLSGAGAQSALNRMLRRGTAGRVGGLDDLRRRLRSARAREQQRLNLAGPLEELRGRLDEILDMERSALSLTEGDDAREREAFLKGLRTLADELMRESARGPLRPHHRGAHRRRPHPDRPL